MKNKRDNLEEGTDFTTQEVRELELKRSNTITSSKRWTDKYPDDKRVVALIPVEEKLIDSKLAASNFGRNNKKGNIRGNKSSNNNYQIPAYLNNLLPDILEVTTEKDNNTPK